MKNFITMFLSICIFASCTPSDYTTTPPPNSRSVMEARKFTYGFPSFFYPPEQYVTRPENFTDIKNRKGNASWTPEPIDIYIDYNSQALPKFQYIERLNKATVSNQSSYDDYLQISGAGFPGYVVNYDNEVFWPSSDYQNGYVCFTLVYRARQDANITEDIPGIPGNLASFIFGKTRLTQADIDGGYVYPGDLVVYDWNPLLGDGYEHIGIISETTGSIENWKVISSLGVIEHFNYGVYEHRLKIFGKAPNGDFSTWQPEWENYTWAIYSGN